MGRKAIESSCRDCSVCTTSNAARGLRELGKKSAVVMSAGTSLMVHAFVKRCRLCGHPMSKHPQESK